jgi:hypothetical protein
MLFDWERSLVNNGRAVLAALYFGRLFEEVGGPRKPLRRLTRLARCGLLPHSTEILRRDVLSERFALRNELNGRL